MGRCQGRGGRLRTSAECAAECGTVHRFAHHEPGKRAQFWLREKGGRRPASARNSFKRFAALPHRRAWPRRLWLARSWLGEAHRVAGWNIVRVPG
jgi:hypothetical protein